MSNTKSLKGVFAAMTKHYKMDGRLKEEQIKSLWKDIVGFYIAKNTKKIKVENNVLYVKMNSPALKNELQYAKSKLLKNLNEKMKDKYIQNIKFY